MIDVPNSSPIKRLKTSVLIPSLDAQIFSICFPFFSGFVPLFQNMESFLFYTQKIRICKTSEWVAWKNDSLQQFLSARLIHKTVKF